MPVTFDPVNKVFCLSSAVSSYVMAIDDENRLLHLHWGAQVPSGSLCFHPEDYCPVASFDLPEAVLPYELPTVGRGWYGLPAVSVRNPEGDDLLDLKVVSWKALSGKPTLSGLPSTYTDRPGEVSSLVISLEDSIISLQVDAFYSIFESTGVITRSLVLRNRGSSPLILTALLSASVPFWSSDLDIVHLKGAWARERSVVRQSLGRGNYSISSLRGASGHADNPFLALCEKNADEFSGRVWAVSLVYSGSFLASCSVDNFAHARLGIGLNPSVFSWALSPGESFTSPEAVLCFSDRGLNGMSQALHSLFRNNLCRTPWKNRERPVLINNWEATYFDFDEEKLLSIAQKAREIGIELFVLDDGWFGRRNNDNCSLGDWTENRRKLPGGLAALSAKIHALGLKFGLWFEPEMVSPDSDLYRSHEDWCLHVTGRSRTQARNQLILDLSRIEVQDYLISALSSVFSSASIDYVKWDMNRNMTEAFSAALPPDRKKETQHRYMLGLYRVLGALTDAFPEILFESCSGGGGRFDPGMLYYMPQTWTSDDTDAAERIRIQYGTSLAYPLASMGAHISAVPNHQTGRTTSLSFRGDVALGGNFGFELDLTALSPEDLAAAGRLVSRAKEFRRLTESGTFWRLLSPFTHTDAAWSVVSEDRRDCLLFAFRTLAVPNTPPLHLQLRGMDPSFVYCTDEGEEYPGSLLMNYGIRLFLKNDFSSRVIRFRAI